MSAATCLLVCVEQFGRDAMALEHTSRAKRVVHARRLWQRIDTVGVGEARRLAKPDQFGDWLEFLFDEDARRVAVTVLHNCKCLDRRDGVARDAGALERLAVGAGDQRQSTSPKAPDGAAVDRVVGRDRIKLLPRRPAPFGEDGRYVEGEW